MDTEQTFVQTLRNLIRTDVNDLTPEQKADGVKACGTFMDKGPDFYDALAVVFLGQFGCPDVRVRLADKADTILSAKLAATLWATDNSLSAAEYFTVIMSACGIPFWIKED